jgi:sodium/proline symporter
MDLEPIALMIVMVYIGGVLAIGWWSLRRVESLRDYLVAGQGMGKWLVSVGVVAAIVSGAGVLGNAGAGYGTGYALYVMTMGLSYLGLTVAYFWLAKPMTVLAKRHQVYTLPDVLALRYNNSNAVRSLSAFAVMLGCFIYIVVQYVAMAWVGTTFFGLSTPLALVVSGLLIAVYTMGSGIMGGMWASLFQTAILVVFVVGIATYGIQRVGGLTELHEGLRQVDPQMLEPWHDSGAFVWQNVLVYAIFVGLLAYAGVPHVSTKFLTIKNLDVLRWIPLISCLLYLLSIPTIWAGMAHRVLASRGELPEAAAPDTSLMTMVMESFGPVMVGLMIAAILAAVMSGAEALVILSAAAVVRDIGKNSLGLRMSERQEMRATRIVGAVLLVGGGLVALNPPDFVLALMAVAWGALAAMLGPVLYVGLRWRRATSQGAVAALVAGISIGGVIGLLNKTLWAEDPLLAPWNVAAIGVIASFTAIVVVSLLTKPQSSQAFSHFDSEAPPVPRAETPRRSAEKLAPGAAPVHRKALGEA